MGIVTVTKVTVTKPKESCAKSLLLFTIQEKKQQENVTLSSTHEKHSFFANKQFKQLFRKSKNN